MKYVWLCDFQLHYHTFLIKDDKCFFNDFVIGFVAFGTSDVIRVTYRLVLISVMKTYYFVLPHDKNLLNRIYSVTQFTIFTFKEEKVGSNMVFIYRSNNIIYPYNESCSSVFQNVLWVFTAVTGVDLLFKVYTVYTELGTIFNEDTVKWTRDDQFWKAIHLYYTGWPENNSLVMKTPWMK